MKSSATAASPAILYLFSKLASDGELLTNGQWAIGGSTEEEEEEEDWDPVGALAEF